MSMKRRWLQSALDESKKPQPKMPWAARKLAVVLTKPAAVPGPRGLASA